LSTARIQFDLTVTGFRESLFKMFKSFNRYAPLIMGIGPFQSFQPFNRCAPFKSLNEASQKHQQPGGTSTFREFSKRRKVEMLGLGDQRCRAPKSTEARSSRFSRSIASLRSKCLKAGTPGPSKGFRSLRAQLHGDIQPHSSFVKDRAGLEKRGQATFVIG
jgi:hypothetical protein